MSSPVFSVIICTYNRADNLAGCVACLGQQRGIGDLAWEVVIVDNNSSDDTRQVIESLGDQYPGLALRYLFEAEQGLSAARNCGIRNTHGRYYLFIDDDIRVTPDWLRSMADALQDNDADAVSGRIHVDPRYPIPAWIRPDMLGFLGHQDFGEVAKRLDAANEFPFGGNMGFNRRVAERVGLFDNNYGRKGEGNKREELLKGEETEYFRRLKAADGQIVYAPGGLVLHQIKPFQLRKRYFRTIHFNQGYLEGFNDTQPHSRRLLGVPWFVFTLTLRSIAKYLRLLLTRGPSFAFRQQMNIGYQLGMILGYHKARSDQTSS